MTETPTISGSSYTTASVSGNQLLMGMAAPAIGAVAPRRLNVLQELDNMHPGRLNPMRAFEEDVQLAGFGLNQKEPIVAMRFVKIFIVDPTEALPLDKRVLHAGAEQLTDLTDQELFFELPIKEMLDKHNAVRVVTLDKRASEKSGKDVFLEPVRVRELKMNVTTVAAF